MLQPLCAQSIRGIKLQTDCGQTESSEIIKKDEAKMLVEASNCLYSEANISHLTLSDNLAFIGKIPLFHTSGHSILHEFLTYFLSSVISLPLLSACIQMCTALHSSILKSTLLLRKINECMPPLRLWWDIHTNTCYLCVYACFLLPWSLKLFVHKPAPLFLLSSLNDFLVWRVHTGGLVIWRLMLFKIKREKCQFRPSFLF